jgi:multidrug efflux pump
MLPRFFIDRPVFAWVIALVLMLAGGLAVLRLPIMQYPAIAPPQVGISASYPGASAQTAQDTVVQVIEQQMNGIDGLDYITSETSADGTASVNLAFKQGTNPDIAQVQVQNKLSAATSLLPVEVQQQGLRVTKPQRNFLVVLGFHSTDDSMSGDDMANFVASNVQDAVARTPGVGDVQLFGAQFAMRIWLDPAKLASYGVNTADVLAAIRAQNVQVSAGQIGGRPAVPGQMLNATIIGPTRLTQPEEFGAILLRVNRDGSQLLLRDVARVTLDAENATTANPRPRFAWPLARLVDRSGRPWKVVPPIEVAYPVARSHQGGRQDAGGAGPGDVPVPAELPRHADPPSRCRW